MYRVLSLAAAAAVAALLASPARAGTVLFEGLGSFAANATANPYVAPGDGFTFSFDLDEATAAAAPKSGGAGGFTTAVDNFVYTLGGVIQDVTLTGVKFDADGIDLLFADKSALEFRDGSDLGSDGQLVSPTWSSYSVFYAAPPPKAVPSFRAFAVSLPPRIGAAMIVTSGPGAGGVPEPAAWALMIAGFGLVGAALRRQSRPVLA